MRRSTKVPRDVEAVGREQIEDDVVVVAGVERDVVAAGFGDGADDIDRLVAVEGRHLDGDDVANFREAAPEREREHASADRGLKIETDDAE